MTPIDSKDGIYRADKYTPAYLTFLLNLARVAMPLLVYDVSRLDPKAIQVSLEKTLPQISKDVIYAVPQALEVLLEWQAVMMVTVTEAYLQDVLSFAAEHDASLMKLSEQSASYQELLTASSLDQITGELRARWARNVLEDGGPTRWKERFERMGARGFEPRTTEIMELHWGIRHVVIHNAGKATTDFVRRHPSFGAVAGTQLNIQRTMLVEWFNAIQNFTQTVEEFAYNRFLRAA